MAKYLPDTGPSELSLWTYKEGLLSRVAHDLRFRVQEWSAPVTVEGERVSVEVTVPVRGISVMGQASHGAVRALKPSDHADIEKNMHAKVLHSDRFPDVRYAGEGTRSGDRLRIEGDLTLCGTTRPVPIEATVRPEGEELVVEGEVRLRQTDFGIKPFSAMLGTLKVQDGVRVSWSLRYRPA